MVMIALDQTVISDINGKRGGENYRYDQCGHHIQQNPKRTKPATPYEIQQRRFFSAVMHAWSRKGWGGDFDDRYSWKYYAQEHPRKNKKGESRIMSAQTMFYSVNIQRLIENQPIIWHAPGITTPPPPPRLIDPETYVETTGWFESTIIIVFPQPMETSIFKTPPHENFYASWSSRDYFGFHWSIYECTKIEWVNAWTLRAYIAGTVSTSECYFHYRRGERGFETAAAPARAYGAFNGNLDHFYIP